MEIAIRRILLSTVLLLLISYLHSQDKGWKKFSICKDENLEFTLLVSPIANMGDSDWLKLKIANKSDFIIHLKGISYSISSEATTGKGEKYIDRGALGQGNQFNLMHFYYDLPNPSDYRNGIAVYPDSSIYVWKHLTNSASYFIGNRYVSEQEVSALFGITAVYERAMDDIEIKGSDRPFCFKWVNVENVSNAELVLRLRELILNPCNGCMNSIITSELMKIPDVVNSITTDELIQGIMVDDKVLSIDMAFLFLGELSRRGAIPNKQLTDYYARKLNAHEGVSSQLQYYWDNLLLDDLLASGEDLRQISRILELNSRFWQIDSANTQRVFTYMANKLDFQMEEKLNEEKLLGWSKAVKTLSISRSPDFIEYLKKYLDNENEFVIEDWSKYNRFGMLPKGAKPNYLAVRICDVAFVALLRALNQFEFTNNNCSEPYCYSVNIKSEILDKEIVNKLVAHSLVAVTIANNIYLDLYEREIKLTPELKKVVLEK